jgi:OTU domain-containing protein 7
MWGFHDRQLTLRKLLSCSMTSGAAASAFQRRWRWQQIQCNKQCGLLLNEDEWQKEWEFLVKLAQPQPKNRAMVTYNTSYQTSRSFAGRSVDNEDIFESLEELHVFVLAHVLRRPIIVFAKSILTDVNGEAFAPIPFGGIYLPLECSPSDCHRSPLLLTYEAAHFCALVWMDTADGDMTIPLVSPKLEVLPIHFVIDPGQDCDWSLLDDEGEGDNEFLTSLDERVMLLEKYMDVRRVPVNPVSITKYPNVASHGTLAPPRRRSLDGVLPPLAGLEEDRKTAGGGVSRQLQDVVKTFGSLGKKIKKIGGTRSRKLSVGTATQSSRKSTLAVEMLVQNNQVLCADLMKRSMFHQDDLVRNYLLQASERFEQLRAQHQQQSDELQRRLSSDYTSPMPGRLFDNTSRGSTDNCGLSKPMLALERQNTLLLTGKSKFYTMAFEDHSKLPEISDLNSDQNADETVESMKTNYAVKSQHYAKPSENGGEKKTNKVVVQQMANATSPAVICVQPAVQVASVRLAQLHDSRPSIRENGSTDAEQATFSSSDRPRLAHSYRCEPDEQNVVLGQGAEARDRNCNDLSWSYSLPNQSVASCVHIGRPNTDCFCSACVQAKRYNSLVGYPTAYTKL